MASGAVIFDLDDTLLDTSSLLDARDRRAWDEVYAPLDEVAIFDVGGDEYPVTRLPGETRERNLPVGLYTHSLSGLLPRYVASLKES